MSLFRIELTPTTPHIVGVKRWCLDYPIAEQTATSVALTEQGLVFQGWVLHDNSSPIVAIQVELRHGACTDHFKLNVARPDVIRIVLKEQPEEHAQLYCGFRFTVQLQAAKFSLGLSVNGEYSQISTGNLCGEFKVLTGRDGWLFLDNDTNQSVEQHLGRLMLDGDCLAMWQQYFSQSLQYRTKWQKPFALLVTPAKEAVYPDFHPLPRAPYTAIEQLLALVGEDYPLVYPQQQLQQSLQSCYLKTDTHWTTYGAMLATIELAVQLGLSRTAVSAIFANDTYRTIQHCGDLGNKLYPQKYAAELTQSSFSCHKLICYDNKLPNFGRIMVINNPAALQQGHCLQFGSSSSYSMLNFITRVFSQVTLIHTAGNIDPYIVQLLQPDFIVAQTNSRFVVRAPEMDYQLKEILQLKLKIMSEAERSLLLAAADECANASNLGAVQLMHQLLLECEASQCQ